MAPKKTLKRPASATCGSSSAGKVACRRIPAKRPAAADQPTASKRPAAVRDDLSSSAALEPSLVRARCTVQRCRQAALEVREHHGDKELCSAGTSPEPAHPLMIKNVPENRTPIQEQVKVVRGVAVPTGEWQVVPKGVACPAGCEYRMCMSSGVNMVRLLQSGAKSSGIPSNGALVVAPGVARDRPKPTRSAASLAPVVDLTQETTPSRSSVTTRQQVQDAPPMTRSAFREQLQQEIQQRRGTRTQAVHAPLQAPGRTLNNSSSSSSSKPAPQVSRDVVHAGNSRTKVVDSEYKRRRVDTGKGGLQKEAQEHVRSRALISRGESGKLSGEKKTLRKEESVEQLEDGRTVVTETITLKKVTVLNKKVTKKVTDAEESD